MPGPAGSNPGNEGEPRKGSGAPGQRGGPKRVRLRVKQVEADLAHGACQTSHSRTRPNSKLEERVSHLEESTRVLRQELAAACLKDVGTVAAYIPGLSWVRVDEILITHLENLAHQCRIYLEEVHHNPQEHCTSRLPGRAR